MLCSGTRPFSPFFRIVNRSVKKSLKPTKVKSPGLVKTPDGQRKVLENFKPRNKLQSLGKQLNLLALDGTIQKKAKEVQQMAETATEQRRFLKENPDSPIVKMNNLTWKLLREVVAHPSYSIIGKIKTTIEQDDKKRLDYTIERFSFDGSQTMGLLAFCFSDEDSLDNFQNQIQGKIVEKAEISHDIFVTLLHQLNSEKDPKHFLDGSESVTNGIVVDPSLPSYFVLSKEKFPELPSLLNQLNIENMLRTLQKEQINPIWPSPISDKTFDSVLPAILSHEFYGFIIEKRDDDGQVVAEDLVTISHVHPEIDENGKYNSQPCSYTYAPLFTDPHIASDYLNVLETYYLEELSLNTISMATITGSTIFNWFSENSEVHGLMFNPKESIVAGTNKLPEQTDPSNQIKKAVPKSEVSLSSDEYYDLPDFPLLPYLCVLKRDILQRDVKVEE